MMIKVLLLSGSHLSGVLDLVLFRGWNLETRSGLQLMSEHMVPEPPCHRSVRLAGLKVSVHILFGHS
ncbi:hypothetical protein PAMP_007584 [Pampus punctatissimus]